MALRSDTNTATRWMARSSIFAAVAALLVFPIAWVLDAKALEIQKIRALDDEAVAANKPLFASGDDVEEIYGARLGDPVRVLFIDESRILHPGEDPRRSLYPTDGEFVLQTRWVDYTAKRAVVG